MAVRHLDIDIAVLKVGLLYDAAFCGSLRRAVRLPQHLNACYGTDALAAVTLYGLELIHSGVLNYVAVGGTLCAKVYGRRGVYGRFVSV